MSLRPAVSCPLQAGRRLETGSLSRVLHRPQPRRPDNPTPVSTARTRSPCTRRYAHNRTTTTVTVTETITTETVTTTTTTTTRPLTTAPLSTPEPPLSATPPTTPPSSHEYTNHLADQGSPAAQGEGVGGQAKQGDPIRWRHLVPHAYNPPTGSWVPSAAVVNSPPLQPRAVVKLVSWNLNKAGPEPSVRARTAMSYLGRTFGNDPGYLVIMLQGLHPSSLQAVLDHKWVRRNFVLSDISPPESYRAATSSRSLRPRPEGGGTTPNVFRLMLISRALPIESCFRVTFKSRYHSDAVVADLALARQAGSRGSTDGEAAVRLCTAGLDLTGRPDAAAARKLALLASILEGSWPPSSLASARVLAGVAGGNWDSHHRDDDADTRLLNWAASHLGLREAYTRPSFRRQPADAEDDSRDAAPPPDAEPERYLHDRRVERFLCTGPLGTVPLAEAQFVDAHSGVGQLGLGLKTDEPVEAWWYWVPTLGRRHYVSSEVAEERRRWVASVQKKPLGISREWTRVPVSWFPAIAVGVRMPH